MTDDQVLVSEVLRAIQGDIASLRNEMRDDFHTLGQRMTALEKHMAALIVRQLPPVWEDLAGLKRRVERIERRLELTE